jgi:hypothetical protein
VCCRAADSKRVVINQNKCQQCIDLKTYPSGVGFGGANKQQLDLSALLAPTALTKPTKAKIDF